MELTIEILEQLAEPFDPIRIKWKIQTDPNPRGWSLVVPYVDARDVAERLDAVVGGNWHDEYCQPQAMNESVQALECRLTVAGVTRVDVGQGNDAKEAYSDAFKRAAVKFGVARSLYRLPRVFAQVEERGGRYVLADQAHEDLQRITPALTAGEALPSVDGVFVPGYRPDKKPQPQPEAQPEAQPKPQPKPQTEEPQAKTGPEPRQAKEPPLTVSSLPIWSPKHWAALWRSIKDETDYYYAPGHAAVALRKLGVEGVTADNAEECLAGLLEYARRKED